MTSLRNLSLFALVAVLSFSPLHTLAQEQKNKTLFKPIDDATIAAFAQIGGQPLQIHPAEAGKYPPGFSFRFAPLGKLPDVAVPFQLRLDVYELTDKALRDLAHLKNLRELELGAPNTPW